MLRTWVTFKGVKHYIMNKGIRGINIFPDDKLKNKFITLLDDKLKKIKVRILTYRIMDNHYHLIL